MPFDSIFYFILSALKYSRLLKPTTYLKNKDKEQLNIIRGDVMDFKPNHEEREKLLAMVNYSVYKDPVKKGTEGKPSLLILDDITITQKLYEFDFNNIQIKQGLDIYKDFQIIFCLGPDCGYEAYKYINIYKNKIDFAILDLTLGTTIKLDNGEYVDMDGVDIAIAILKNNPDAKILFSTAHTLDINNRTVEQYVAKFEQFSNIRIDENQKYYMNKNSDRVKTLLKLLYGVDS